MDGLSALMDGELNELDAQREIARLRSDPESRERWESFHVIGDAMRGQPRAMALKVVFIRVTTLIQNNRIRLLPGAWKVKI